LVQWARIAALALAAQIVTGLAFPEHTEDGGLNSYGLGTPQDFIDARGTASPALPQNP
jgi:hypothetical protein